MDKVQIYEIIDKNTEEIIGYTFTTDHIGRGVLCSLEGDGLGGSVNGLDKSNLHCNNVAVRAEWWGEREF